MTIKTICECGMLVKGTSQKHLAANMEKHKRGKRHKELLKLKKSVGA